MADTTKIEWAQKTFNGWIGCSKIHTGCQSCYAEADQAIRRKRVVWGPNGTRSKTSDAYWKQPLKWNKDAKWAGCCDRCGRTDDFVSNSKQCGCGGVAYDRPRVFCGSLCDVWEDWQGPIVDAQGQRLWMYPPDHPGGQYVPEAHYDESDLKDNGWRLVTMSDLRADLFRLIDATPNLDWLLLTKRPENILKMWPELGPHFTGGFYNLKTDRRFNYAHTGEGKGLNAKYAPLDCGFRSNCWIGTSVSNQGSADRMIPELLKCGDLAPVLFVSAEPLLGPIDWTKFLYPVCGPEDGHGCPPIEREATLDWLIFGGES